MVDTLQDRPVSRSRVYPFARILLSVGAFSAIIVAGVSDDILMGAIIFVGFSCAGLLWRRAEVPIFTFCTLYQWLFIGAGYVYLRIVGSYPGIPYLGDLDLAIWYSLAGLLCIIFGIRTALHSHQYKGETTNEKYDITKLFWIVVILFSVNWTMELSAVQLRLAAFNISQILHHILILRYLFLYLLLLTIVQQGRQYSLGILAFAYVLLPVLTSSMTKFKELFFLVVLVLLSQWQPFSRSQSERIRNRNILAVVFLVTVFLIVVGLVWSGGLKYNWRTALLSGEVAGSPIEKIEAYGQYAADSIGRFEPKRATETLISRLSSGIAYYSHVVRVVPDIVPHENGKLTWRTIQHVSMPRFLFPEKPQLGGDSWIVRKYARLNVSGDESGTSIGLGYMAEFYIDFGFQGMLAALYIYGLILGVIYIVLNKLTPSRAIFSAVISGLLLQHFLSFEGNFTKLFGGILQNFLILSVILFFYGEKTHRFLLKKIDSARKSPHSIPNHATGRRTQVEK